MIDLLIVDDEETIREGLRDYVPWHEMGINIQIGRAS
ncbi:MAG: two-component system, response regulator YesN, partial [Clostridiales bacterium]|nr:two-component system, response regulator YesN [Clostridiales bacterium]